MANCCRNTLRFLLYYRNQWMLYLTPLLLLPLPLVVDGKAAMAGYCLLLMATYWCTEAVPMPVTALIPLFLFPMLGVLKIDEVVVNYSKSGSKVVYRLHDFN
ncbi:hypothetical protein CAPTEDRAFT_194603 [Capitella teleta]|uniref:Uncharacterized protein n=1 Tax=Capitella teleta TaxID=283909 RepID=R7T4C2_CAPTE|nr:hypothetical protein CAPTEDRAFT_194603 [Capitella teleta]|eukprot:ELT87718.1 hypothetical protein CAPTEDRAFT_194603 [Capitella teleta]